MIPAWLHTLYPFTSRAMRLPPSDNDANVLHYVDEGEGEVILCLHGNPTWSFFYRNVIKEFRQSHRVIALDHLGCGASSKPQTGFDYRLAGHIDNLEHFIATLGLKNITLVLHDWGGAIGMGWAVRHPDAVKRIILLNTAAFRSVDIPKRIAVCKTPGIGEAMIRRFNAFARAALVMATAKSLAPAIKKGLLWPYDSYANRIAIARFVQDIPLREGDASYATLADIEAKLPTLRCPKLVLWGLRDFCFHKGFLQEWQRFYPDAQVETFADAGHYVLEDAPDAVHAAMARFLAHA